MPRRGDFFVKLDRDAYAVGTAAGGPWTHGGGALLCKEPQCLFVAEYGKALRRVHKFKVSERVGP